MVWKRQKAPPQVVELPERDARILEKYERRAKQFDEMIKVCCCWIGYDVMLDLIPFVGKCISLGFSLSMYRLACQAELPSSLRRRMMYHTSVDFVLGMIPILGILLTMLYRANTKNARLLRRFLYQRAEQDPQNIKTTAASTSAMLESSGRPAVVENTPSYATAPAATADPKETDNTSLSMQQASSPAKPATPTTQTATGAEAAPPELPPRDRRES
ncbi:hypothetical protein BCR43DRAFT_487019 [Syncephalastrum racemosum]|uniref:Uncharacterized protein n=1 Tax=Syncephalastrum racemosum TaxID=13706 RepID=A0A1X2HQ33_SYNRA|nr:hypothetical protein BCR43DRAFT_487019 [Syncephalastrum racemosum]